MLPECGANDIMLCFLGKIRRNFFHKNKKYIKYTVSGVNFGEY